MEENNNEPWADFVAFDLLGFPYNCKYPPNIKRYGYKYEGYATESRLVFFYDFSIQFYGVVFYHGDNRYKAEFTPDGPILTNYQDNSVQGPFDGAVNLIEEAIIDGHKLIDIIDDLDHFDLH